MHLLLCLCKQNMFFFVHCYRRFQQTAISMVTNWLSRILLRLFFWYANVSNHQAVNWRATSVRFSDNQVTHVDMGGVGKWPSGPHRPEPQRDNSSLRFVKGSFGKVTAIFQPPRLSRPPSPHRILSIHYFSSCQEWSWGGIFKSHGFWLLIII